MNGLGHTAGSKSKTQLRSPQAHSNQDPRLYKRKYEEARELLRQEKKNNEQLQLQLAALQARLSEQDALAHQQERELQKKEEINEVLLDRIRCLKNALAEQTRKSGNDSSSEDKNCSKSKSSTLNEEPPQKNSPVVGGYFGSIFK